jgi:xanthine dehydrogenase YagS FAD-binding subunit
MNAFEFINAQSAATARELTRDGKGRLHAGGIDLLGQLKEGLDSPARLVNVKSIPGLDTLAREKDAWTIGANVKLARLAADPDLHAELPGLAEAAAEVGSPQIRNIATVGGNLAQHSRCWYYRHPDLRCLKNDGPRCYAREGENKHHALFSRNSCISPVVSNLAVALAALGATVTVEGRRGAEDWSLDELFEDAWENPRAHHSLRPGDVITGVRVPRLPGQRSHYRQIMEKGDFDWALVSCAVAARVDGRRLSDVRLVLGCIAPGPFQLAAVNASLEGRDLTEELAAEAAAQLLADAEPREHNAYKVPMARALAKRSLLALVA